MQSSFDGPGMGRSSGVFRLATSLTVLRRGGDAVFVTAALIEGARALPGVARVEGQRVASIQLDAQRPAVALIARPMDDAARRLPLLGELFDAPAGITAVTLPALMADPLPTIGGYWQQLVTVPAAARAVLGALRTALAPDPAIGALLARAILEEAAGIGGLHSRRHVDLCHRFEPRFQH